MTTDLNAADLNSGDLYATELNCAEKDVGKLESAELESANLQSAEMATEVASYQATSSAAQHEQRYGLRRNIGYLVSLLGRPVLAMLFLCIVTLVTVRIWHGDLKSLSSLLSGEPIHISVCHHENDPSSVLDVSLRNLTLSQVEVFGLSSDCNHTPLLESRSFRIKPLSQCSIPVWKRPQDDMEHAMDSLAENEHEHPAAQVSMMIYSSLPNSPIAVDLGK